MEQILKHANLIVSVAANDIPVVTVLNAAFDIYCEYFSFILKLNTKINQITLEDLGHKV